MQTSDTTSNGYFTAANYAVFSGLSGPSNTVTCQFRDMDQWGGIAGIQVVNTATGPSVNPVIQSIVVSGGSATLTFASESSASYTVQSKAALTDATWVDKQVVASPSDGTTSEPVTITGDVEFYRIKAE